MIYDYNYSISIKHFLRNQHQGKHVTCMSNMIRNDAICTMIGFLLKFMSNP